MKLLSFLSRFGVFRNLFSWVLKHMNFIIPEVLIRETDTLLAFMHPKPGYQLHIVILPKKEYQSIIDVDSDDTKLLSDLIEVVKSIVEEYQLADKGYRLITNGGKYQEIRYLHFHLVSDEIP